MQSDKVYTIAEILRIRHHCRMFRVDTENLALDFLCEGLTPGQVLERLKNIDGKMSKSKLIVGERL